MNSNSITEVASPKTAGDAANKLYVDNAVEGIKKMVKVNVVNNVMSLQRMTGDNSKHLGEKYMYKARTKEIKTLKYCLLRKIPTYYRIEALIIKSKNINDLVCTS